MHTQDANSGWIIYGYSLRRRVGKRQPNCLLNNQVESQTDLTPQTSTSTVSTHLFYEIIEWGDFVSTYPEADKLIREDAMIYRIYSNYLNYSQSAVAGVMRS